MQQTTFAAKRPKPPHHPGAPRPNLNALPATQDITEARHPTRDAPPRRRSNWAAVMEHLVPGGRHMNDPELELWVLEMLRRPAA